MPSTSGLSSESTGVARAAPGAHSVSSRRDSLASRDAVVLALLVAAGALFYLAPWPAMYVPALVAVIVFTWWRLDLALTLVVLSAPLFMLPKHLGSKEFTPTEILLAIDTLVAAGLFVFRGEQSFAWNRARRSHFLVPLAIFLVAATVSTALAADRHLALYAWARVALAPAIYFLLLLLVPTHRTFRIVLVVSLVGSGLLVAGIAIVQLVTNQGLVHVSGSSIPRVEALYRSQDNLGLLLDRVIPFVISLGLVLRLRRYLRAAWIAVALVLLTTLFFTSSQGAWLGVAVATLFALVLTYPWGRWLALACISLLAIALAAKGPSIVHAVRAGHSNTIERRLDIWRSSVHMIRDYPLFGVGSDNFGHYYAPVNQPYATCRGLGYMQPEAHDEPCLSHPHNELLDAWLSAGIVGLIAFIWIQITFWRECIAGWRARLENVDRALLLGVMSAMLAAEVHGLVDNSYFLTDLALIFWLLCAGVVYICTSAGRDIAGA